MVPSLWGAWEHCWSFSLWGAWGTIGGTNCFLRRCCLLCSGGLLTLWWIALDYTLMNCTLVNCSGRSPEPGDCLHRNASLHHTPETPQCSYNTIYHHITPNIWRINLLDCPQSLFYFVPHSQVASAPINYMAIVHSGVSLILSAPLYVWAKKGYCCQQGINLSTLLSIGIF